MRTRRPKKWAYRNTTLLLVSLAVFLILADTPLAHELVAHIGRYGYVGAAVAGIFFVSTFTVAPASVVLFTIAEQYDPFYVALAAGAGGMIGDVFLFRFFKSRLFDELAPLTKQLRRSHLFALFKTPHFVWLTPVLGAIIIALPFLPDEAGIGLMGLTKIKQWQFMLLTFALNVAGLLLVILAAQTV
jgi:uncharacterized membrane protein YdjX (TVP38/TMEM64 family)